MAQACGIDDILDDVSSYLEWQRDEAVPTVAIRREVLDELGKGAVASPEKSGHAGEPAASKAEPPPPSPPSRSVSPVESASVSNGDSLQAISNEIAACTRCVLHKSRTNPVPGEGLTSAPDIMFIGEAPGADEDAQGRPFVGRSGQLLTRMIEAMGYTRENVFIGNINKCRPPGNRKPAPDEMACCLPFLKRQIALIKPAVIVALGATAVEGLVGMPKGVGITKVRGQWLEFEGIPLMPTFHPAYMLRNPKMKRPVWEDLKAVLRQLGKPLPPPKK